jgi:Fe-S-cluster-containing hydrogenase component 2
MAQAMQAEKQLQASPLSAAPKPAANSTQLSLSWTSLLDKGVVQGHELLVIDQNRCTNCNNCVDACGRRHGYGRLERRGLQIENLLFPTACRHCEDPVCLLCSVNGIVRLPNGEITIVDDNCIGCGACAQRCPYGNIQMHEVREERPNLWFDLWDLLRGGVAQQRAVEQLNPKKAYKAVKCDLCAGYDDYACVTACPVSAAFRINPVQAFGRDDLLIGLEMKRKA